MVIKLGTLWEGLDFYSGALKERSSLERFAYLNSVILFNFEG